MNGRVAQSVINHVVCVAVRCAAATAYKQKSVYNDSTAVCVRRPGAGRHRGNVSAGQSGAGEGGVLALARYGPKLANVSGP